MLALHGFFNSSASYRVRIALALKNLPCEHVGVNIRSGAQNEPAYKTLNPTGLVPTLQHDDLSIAQSLAIIDHLDALQPEPRLVPSEGPSRTRVLEIAHLIACDVHPLNNLRVLKFLSGPMALSADQKTTWTTHWLTQGFDAIEALLPDHGDWCVSDTPTLADCCLVPQVANALRAGFDLARYPRIRRIHAHCETQRAFIAARPSAQPDFVPA
jgi:maleylacetoacetate isomerase